MKKKDCIRRIYTYNKKNDKPQQIKADIWYVQESWIMPLLFN